jgi:hypothetical protein
MIECGGVLICYLLHIDGEYTINSDVLMRQDAEIQYYECQIGLIKQNLSYNYV